MAYGLKVSSCHPLKQNRRIFLYNWVWNIFPDLCDLWPHTERQHIMSGTIQKKKDSLSDFQWFLFVFKCVVISSSYLLRRRFTHFKDRPSLLNTGNSESCLCDSIVYTLQVKTWGHSLLELLHNGECISGPQSDNCDQNKCMTWLLLVEVIVFNDKISFKNSNLPFSRLIWSSILGK